MAAVCVVRLSSRLRRSYDIRELLDSTVKLMDGKSPLDIELPGPLNLLKKPLLKMVHGTVVEKVLEDHDIIRK